MKFDLFNSDTWNLADENTPLIYNGQVVKNNKGEFIKTLDFIHFLQAVASITKQTEIKKSVIEKLIKRMIDGQNEPAEEPFILNLESEDKTVSGFNPFDESTWDLASKKRIFRYKNERFVNDARNTEYISEKDFIDEVRGLIKYKTWKKETANTQDIVVGVIKNKQLLNAEKDLEPVFSVNGFAFTKALCDCCRDTEKETLEKIAEAMNSCIGQNLKKYQYKQYFFENDIPASKEFFIEVYFAEQSSPRKSVDDLIISFYSEFEPETKEEIDSIISGSLYLSAHKELIPPIKEHLLTRYF